MYCTFCKYKLDQSNDADLNTMVESVQKDYGIRFVTVVRGFGSKESNERKAARKYLKRALKLGFSSIKNRFENDDDFASHMKDEKRDIEEIERLDDLARMPTDVLPMSYEQRVQKGLTVTRTVEEGAAPGGGSDTVRGQKRWNERQWQEWKDWSQSRGWDWR